MKTPITVRRTYKKPPYNCQMVVPHHVITHVNHLHMILCKLIYPGYSYVSKNVKLQQADFLINISSLDILKTLLHKCRVSPSEGIPVLNFLSADANMCLHKVRMRITAVRHIFHRPWRMRICCKNTSGTLSTKKSTN